MGSNRLGFAPAGASPWRRRRQNLGQSARRLTLSITAPARVLMRADLQSQARGSIKGALRGLKPSMVTLISRQKVPQVVAHH